MLIRSAVLLLMTVSVWLPAADCLAAPGDAPGGPASRALMELSPGPAGARLPAPYAEAAEVQDPETEALTAEEAELTGLEPSADYSGSDKSAYNSSVRDKITQMLALSASRGPDAGAYSRMYRTWTRGVQVLVSNGPRDFEVCVRRGALAISSAGKPIYLCRLEINNYPEWHTLQVLIHELAHVSGYGGECTATRLARGAARNYGLTPYENGYITSGRCPR